MPEESWSTLDEREDELEHRPVEILHLQDGEISQRILEAGLAIACFGTNGANARP